MATFTARVYTGVEIEDGQAFTDNMVATDEVLGTIEAPYPMAALSALRARNDLVGKARRWVSCLDFTAAYELPDGRFVGLRDEDRR